MHERDSNVVLPVLVVRDHPAPTSTTLFMSQADSQTSVTTDSPSSLARRRSADSAGMEHVDANATVKLQQSGAVNGNCVLQQSSPLSASRDIVSLLDAEATFDYLVQNGVLTSSDVAEICEIRDTTGQNRRLLDLVESRKDNSAVQLLTNVLRLTGQHYIANRLDDGQRIKALSGSGYLSKSRHRGQISMTILIRSMQLPADPQLKSLSSLLATDWISLEDIQMKMSSLKRSQRSSTAVHHDISPVVEETTWLEADPGCCWTCCCCCCLPPRRRLPRVAEKYTVGNTHSNAAEPAGGEQKSLVITYQPGRVQSTSVECIKSAADRDSDIGSLRHAADAVQSRCAAIYAAIGELGTTLRTELQRYFEQERGVLVLRVESLGVASGSVICCICTRLEHVAQFRDDRLEQLVDDLEKIIQLATGTRVHLDVTLDDGDLETAELELRAV